MVEGSSAMMTWSRRLHPAPIEERMDVSEIGELWSPKIAPVKTAEEHIRM